MIEENWKSIIGYEGYYEASSLGKIRSVDRIVTNRLNVIRPLNGKDLSKVINKGYEYVALCKDGVPKLYSVHQLVAMAFLDHNPCGHKFVIDHIDGNPLNNNVDNIEIVTQSINVQRGYDKARSCSKQLG